MQGSNRRPAWALWAVYIGSVISGVAIVVTALRPALHETPTLAAASVAVFGAFGAAVTWLLNKVPYFCAPPRSIRALAFVWGAFAAAGFALLANSAIRDHLAAAGDAGSWSLFAPLTEEPAKGAGIVIVLLLAGGRTRTALDGLVVGSFVGLGFEVVENIVQSINNAIASYPVGQRDNLGSLATDAIHEVLRRSWTGHIVITGIAGFGIGYAMTARDRSPAHRWTVAVSLVSLAFAGHLLWNSHRFGVFYVIGQFGLLAFYLWLIRVGRAEEARVYLPHLADGATPLIDPAELDSMRSARARKAARKAATASGAASPGHVRKRQRAIADVAAALGNGETERAKRSIEALAG